MKLTELLATNGLRVGVQTEENALVDEGVLVLRPGALLVLRVRGADNRLDLVTVNQAGDVRVRDLRRREDVVLLVRRRLVERAEHLVEQSKRALSPDDETAEVAARCELEKVEAAHVDEFDAGKVAERADDALVLVVDDKRAAALAVAPVAQLALTRAELARVRDLDDVGVRLERLEESNGFLGLSEALGLSGDDEGNLLDLLDAVAAGEDERGEGGRGERRDDGEAALVLVHLDVPLAPGLRRREHATATAHVAEGSLRSRVNAFRKPW